MNTSGESFVLVIFHHCEKIPEKTITGRKGFICLMVSKVSLLGLLAPLFLGHGEA
jgi:hypothetical protein